MCTRFFSCNLERCNLFGLDCCSHTSLRWLHGQAGWFRPLIRMVQSKDDGSIHSLESFHPLTRCCQLLTRRFDHLTGIWLLSSWQIIPFVWLLTLLLARIYSPFERADGMVLFAGQYSIQPNKIFHSLQKDQVVLLNIHIGPKLSLSPTAINYAWFSAIFHILVLYSICKMLISSGGWEVRSPEGNSSCLWQKKVR